MKTIKQFLKPMLLAFLIIAGFSVTRAQDSTVTENKSEHTIEQLLNAKQFVFVPQSVLPTTGRMRQLTSYYDVTLKGNTLISFLPYFGRTYTAPVDFTRSALDFTSNSFEYNVENRKKGGWDVIVKPKDQTNVRQYMFTVFDNGSATLRVLSNNSQPITFNGYVTESKQRS